MDTLTPVYVDPPSPSAGSAAQATTAPGLCVPQDGEVAYGLVAWVINGDTIMVDLQGQLRSVRYLGIDALENSSDAKSRNEQLVGQRVVKLVSGPVDKDRHGQLLRYVFVQDYFINHMLVREGVASLDAALDDPCWDVLSDAEMLAQEEKLGMWQTIDWGSVSTPVPPTRAATPTRMLVPFQTASPTLPVIQATLTLPGTQPVVTTQAPTLTTPLPTLPLEDLEVYLIDIYYDGDPAINERDEYVELINLGLQEVSLAGWRLRASLLGAEFQFPDYKLQPDEICRVYTNEIHPEYCGFSFGSASAIWNDNGECADLYEPGGTIFDQYCYGDQE